MRKMFHRTCAILLCTTAAVPAWAQGATPQPAAGATSTPVSDAASAAAQNGLADIVVTARRKAENLEKVPVSITAFGAEQLQQRAIRTEADLQIATPGLVVRQTLSQNQLNYSIRGQSVDAFSGSAPGVLPYINEVQVSASTATSFFDLGSVQVLKGPQGTLFGRNTTGGAVLYQTQKPTNEFGGYLLGRYGNFDTKAVQGAINVPIVSDKILLRVAGDYDKSDGYIRNFYDGSYSGGQDARSVRVSLTVKPFEGLTNEFTGQYGWFGGTNAETTLYSVNACGSTNNVYTLLSSTACLYDPSFAGFGAFLAAHPGAYPNGLAALVAFDRSLGKFTSYNDFPSRHRAHSGFITDALSYEISPDLTVKNIVGLTKSRSNEQNDLDASPYPIFGAGTAADPLGESFRTHQFSDELQLQGKALDHRLTYILGGYYSFQRDSQDYPLIAFDLTPTIQPSPVHYGWTTRDRSRALFAQANYKFTDKLSFTGGFRYTWETASIDQAPGTIFFGAPGEKANFSKPSWTAGFDYQANNNLLLYVTTRGSWRAGGFNGFAPAVAATAAGGGNFFRPETTHDVEVGAKYSGRVADLPIRLNIALYNQWISNVQRTAYVVLNGNPLSFTANVPGAEVTGFELDGNIKPARWLELGGSLAYAHARFTSPIVSFFGTTVPFGPYADTPEWSGSVYAQVTVPLSGDAGTLGFRADLYAQTGQYFSNLNSTLEPGTHLPGYSLVNLRLDWTKPFDLPIVLSGFAKNVGNKVYFVGGVPQGADLGLNNASWGRPRMYGAEVRFNF